MGGRGSSGSAKIPSSGMNNTSKKEIQKKADLEKATDLYNELQNRTYSKTNAKIPEKYKQIYKDAKRRIKAFIEDNGNNEIVGLGGGFGDENFSDLNSRALNSFQALVREDARRLAVDIKLGVRHIGSVDQQVAILKSLDNMIQERRKLLAKVNKGEW